MRETGPIPKRQEVCQLFLASAFEKSERIRIIKITYRRGRVKGLIASPFSAAWLCRSLPTLTDRSSARIRPQQFQSQGFFGHGRDGAAHTQILLVPLKLDEELIFLRLAD